MTKQTEIPDWKTLLVFSQMPTLKMNSATTYQFYFEAVSYSIPGYRALHSKVY